MKTVLVTGKFSCGIRFLREWAGSITRNGEKIPFANAAISATISSQHIKIAFEATTCVYHVHYL
jgi:hypothetical protein